MPLELILTSGSPFSTLSLFNVRHSALDFWYSDLIFSVISSDPGLKLSTSLIQSGKMAARSPSFSDSKSVNDPVVINQNSFMKGYGVIGEGFL